MTAAASANVGVMSNRAAIPLIIGRNTMLSCFCCCHSSSLILPNNQQPPIILALNAAEEFEKQNQDHDTDARCGEGAFGADVPVRGEEACVYCVPVPEHLFVCDNVNADSQFVLKNWVIDWLIRNVVEGKEKNGQEVVWRLTEDLHPLELLLLISIIIPGMFIAEGAVVGKFGVGLLAVVVVVVVCMVMVTEVVIDVFIAVVTISCIY